MSEIWKVAEWYRGDETSWIAKRVDLVAEADWIHSPSAEGIEARNQMILTSLTQIDDLCWILDYIKNKLREASKEEGNS